jgi:hypothetical protein
VVLRCERRLEDSRRDRARRDARGARPRRATRPRARTRPPARATTRRRGTKRNGCNTGGASCTAPPAPSVTPTGRRSARPAGKRSRSRSTRSTAASAAPAARGKPAAASTAHLRRPATTCPVQARPPRPNKPIGITAHALLERRGNLGRLTPDELEAWLLDAGLAELDGGPHLLVPTTHAHVLVRGLDRLG